MDHAQHAWIDRFQRSSDNRTDGRRPGSGSLRHMKIAYLLSNGLAYRMIRDSGVLNELLARGHQVTLIGPRDPAAADQDDPGLGTAAWGPAIEDARCLSPRFKPWWPHIFSNARSVSVRNRAIQASRRESPRSRARGRVQLAVQKVGALDRSATVRRWLFAVLASSEGARSLLDEVAPDVVVSTCPYLAEEAVLLATARRQRIPVVGHILSWDNVTVRGVLPVACDSYLAWGPQMEREIRSLYPEASTVWVCGAPHFGIHVPTARTPSNQFASSEHPPVTKEALARAGLDPSAPFILAALSLPIHVPDELGVIPQLAAYLRSRGVQLLLRPHPQGLSGPYPADTSWRQQLDDFAALPGIGINYPIVDGPLDWSVTDADLIELNSLLASCILVITAGSTVALEAMAVDTPVVVAVVDELPRPHHQSAARVLDYPHIQTMLDLSRLPVATSMPEVMVEIEELLDNPDLGAPARARAVYEIAGPRREARHLVVDAIERSILGECPRRERPS